jgi:hypothetical protein
MGHAMTELGITGILLTTAILTAPILLLLSRRRLPAGATTIVVGLNAFAMGFLYDAGPYPRAVVAAVVLSAVAIDIVRAALGPGPGRPRAFRAYACALGLAPTAAYFTALAATNGIVWSTPLWAGVIVFTGAVGWLLSYLVVTGRADGGRPD